MTKLQTLPEPIVALSRQQFGAVSRAQYLEAGVSGKVVARLIRNGDARSLATGTIALTPPCWMQTVWAGLLIGGEGATIGGLAAAQLNGLLEQPPQVIDIYAPRSRPPRDGPWCFHRAPRIGTGRPPRTTMAQTLVDLARTVSEDEMAALLAKADYRLDTGEALELLARYQRHRGHTVLQQAIVDADHGVKSALESRYVRLVERPHLPPATRQARPLGAHACDNLYKEYQLIIELDVRRYHDGLVASHDAHLDNQHLLAGYVTMRFGWDDVTKSPCRVASEIAQALASRGWRGRLKKCPRCH